MVPVCFFKKLSATGLRSPFTCPSVLQSPYSVCACSPILNSPPRLAAYLSYGSTMGLEVVWWQKVEPVGLMLGGNLDL